MKYDVLYFEISGNQAEFTLPDSTSSKLTYDFMPYTAIRGMLGAVVGHDRPTYQSVFSPDNVDLGIKIIDLGTITNYAMNLRNLDINEASPRWITARYNVRYGIYVKANDPQVPMEQLHERLSKHKYVYPVTLGKRHCIANVDNVHMLEATIRQTEKDETVQVDSVITTDWGMPDRPIRTEFIPYFYDIMENLVSGQYKEVYYDDKPISIRTRRPQQLYDVNGRLIQML